MAISFKFYYERFTIIKAQAYLRILRPTQWLKNLILFFPPFLGGTLFPLDEVLKGGLSFVSFCFASSAAYIVNDIFDADADSQHPKKKYRPIPSMKISKVNAALFSLILLAGALLSALSISTQFLLILSAYVSLTLAYSVWLKKIAIVDLFCISAGFLLRLYAGGEVFSVDISDWLFLSVFLLSIFLSAGKRHGEVESLGGVACTHRISLASYPAGVLEGVMFMTGSTVLVTYTMYVITKPVLVYTVPLCTFGLLRYIIRVKSGRSGDPTESLLRDLPLLFTGALWAFMVGWSIY